MSSCYGEVVLWGELGHGVTCFKIWGEVSGKLKLHRNSGTPKQKLVCMARRGYLGSTLLVCRAVA